MQSAGCLVNRSMRAQECAMTMDENGFLLRRNDGWRMGCRAMFSPLAAVVFPRLPTFSLPLVQRRQDRRERFDRFDRVRVEHQLHVPDADPGERSQGFGQL